MDFSAINWLAVLACVVASMVIGFVWYSPNVFFTTWWKGIGKTEEPDPTDANGMTWGLTILASLVQAVFVAVFINALGGLFGGPSLMAGVQVGFWLWLGIVAPTNLVNKLFAGYEMKVFFIEAGNHLLNFLAFGAILGAWR